MPLIDRIQTDLVAAMRARDEPRLSALRMIKTALDRAAKEKRGSLDEAGENKVLDTLANQRRESVRMFLDGNRPELAAKEAAELLLIETFMPSAASEEEIDAAVTSAIAAHAGVVDRATMGLIMKTAKATLAGKRVDGKMVADKVKAHVQV